MPPLPSQNTPSWEHTFSKVFSIHSRETNLCLEDGTHRDGIIVGVSIATGILLLASIMCLVVACRQRVKATRLRLRYIDLKKRKRSTAPANQGVPAVESVPNNEARAASPSRQESLSLPSPEEIPTQPSPVIENRGRSYGSSGSRDGRR